VVSFYKPWSKKAVDARMDQDEKPEIYWYSISEKKGGDDNLEIEKGGRGRLSVSK